MPETLSTAAMALASMSLHVFPCDPLTKRPLTGNGFHDATTDAGRIGGWWQQWPHAMVAIATGAKSRIVVLDVDVKNDVDGFPALEALRKQEDFPADCLSAKTPSGGRHFYFTWDPARPIGNSAGTIGKGLDVRGEGGYVIAPPSIDRLSRPYTWSPWGPLYPAPSWLHRKAPEPEARQPFTPPAGSQDRVAYVKAAVAEELKLVAYAAEGQRNHQLNTSAFALFRLVHECGVPALGIEDALLQAALHAGLSRIEALNTIRSARKARGVA